MSVLLALQVGGQDAAGLAGRHQAAPGVGDEEGLERSRPRRRPARSTALPARSPMELATRGLMPAGETSGVLSPNLKSEEN